MSAGSNLPWDGAASRADMICLGGITFSGIYYLALLPAVPSLVGTHPVLLELFRGSMTSMITMGALARTGHASLIVAVVAGIPGSMMFDWLYWWAGRRWGPRALQFVSGRQRRRAQRGQRVERIARRWGPLAVVLAYFLPVPQVLIYIAVGWTGMRLATFLLLDVVGTLLWVATMVALGYAIGQRAVDVAHAISHYALWSTIALVVGIVLYQGWAARREQSPQ